MAARKSGGVYGGSAAVGRSRLDEGEGRASSDARPFRLRMFEGAEFDHQCSLVSVLRSWSHRDCLWFAIPNQSDAGARRGAILKRMGVRAGMSDLFFLFEGRSFFLELKTWHGSQSESQRVVEQLTTAAGGEYEISRSLEQSVKLLRSRGIITRNLLI